MGNTRAGNSKNIEIDISHTEQALYDDWNLAVDQLGQILGYEDHRRSEKDIAVQ